MPATVDIAIAHNVEVWTPMETHRYGVFGAASGDYFRITASGTSGNPPNSFVDTYGKRNVFISFWVKAPADIGQYDEFYFGNHQNKKSTTYNNAYGVAAMQNFGDPYYIGYYFFGPSTGGRSSEGYFKPYFNTSDYSGWHHVAALFYNDNPNSGVYTWLDGNPGYQNGDYTYVDYGTRMIWGLDMDVSSRYVGIGIDDFVIAQELPWANRANPTEIASLIGAQLEYNGERKSTFSPLLAPDPQTVLTGIYHYWKFDNLNGGEVKDEIVTNGLDWALYGNATLVDHE